MSASRSLRLEQDNLVLLRPASVAKMLEISERTLWRWASEGSFSPPDVRKGAKFIRWKRETVEQWIQAQPKEE